MPDESAEETAGQAEEATEAAEPAEKAPARAPRVAVAAAGAGAGGHAVVVARPPLPGPALPQISRRGMLLTAWWAGIGGLLVAIVATMLNSIYPRKVTGFGSKIFVGTIDQLEAGQKLHNLEAKAWVVRLDAEQARRNGGQEGAVIALYQKCPHLGCTVPYRAEFSREDPRNGETYSGWFLCPCHGSTYSDAGVRVFGPAPRSMDTFEMSIDGGKIVVNTATIITGDLDNGQRGVVPG